MLSTISRDQDSLSPDLDWDAEISAVVTSTAGDSEAENSIARELPWADALYYDGSDFRDLIVAGQTDTYHHRIHGIFLTAFQFSDPQVQADNSLTAQGRLYAASEDSRNDYHTDFSRTLVEALIIIRLKNARTTEVLRNYILENHQGPDAAPAA